MENNKKQPLFISMRGNRLFLEQRTKNTHIEVDITPVWHFFGQVIKSLDIPNNENAAKLIDELFGNKEE